MPSIVDSLNLISTTMENILDFVAKDEVLSQDFQKYLEINEIEIETEKEFNNVIIQYMLDGKMQNGLRVLEYYKRNNTSCDEIITALQNSFCGVFQIKKILSNAYEVNCLTSNVNLTLIPMVKMSHLKQIGRFDYIKARIIELDSVQYILEIYDIISEFNVFEATQEAIKYMLEAPKSAHYKNDKKKEELEKSTNEFYTKFIELFEQDFVITTNKKIDNLIEVFNLYRLNNEKIDFSNLIENVEKNRFLNIKEFETESNNFLQNAIGGFSSHKETYDVALWMDKKRGLYVIPFLETFLKSFNENIEGKDECIKDFLLNDKVPPGILKYAMEKSENFFDEINRILNTDFSTLESILFNTKTAYIDDGIFSPINILFNSELFSTLLGFNDTKENENNKQNIGRNELCPCGSGLKYKNCCAKN